MRACYAIGAASGTISAEETAVLNQIAGELDIDAPALNAIRAEFHDRMSSVQRVRRLGGTS
jgi:tellurite resistance protein